LFAGFVSCGSAKGQGFSGYILNIYCPKGTKMMYAEPFSHYGDGAKLNWNGISKQSSFGYEDENDYSARDNVQSDQGG
jgi:hypothetical protein